MKNWKNRQKKLLIIGPNPLILQSSPGHSPQLKIDFPYYGISGTDICCRICNFSGVRTVLSLLILERGLVVQERQHSNLFNLSIELGAGIEIVDVSQPNILTSFKLNYSNLINCIC